MPFHFILATAVLSLVNADVSGKVGLRGKGRRGDEAGSPYLLPLHRETVPVRQNGEVVSLKTAYSGRVSLGGPASQEFSVVFDTGSGHVVLPSSSCDAATCLAHRRYNLSESPKAWQINADGEAVPEDELCDQATIGFGTGTVTGEFVHESVCLGPGRKEAVGGLKRANGDKKNDAPCATMSVVVAVEMSAQPFESFKFDGIFGLSLDSLALSSQFSFFSNFAEQPKTLPHFGFFLSDGRHGEQSEIAVGGHNSARVMGPLNWAPVTKPKLGFWQIKIRAVRIGGVELAECKKGGCSGVLDTGTSHLGIPSHQINTVTQLMTKDVGDACNLAAAPKVSIDINDFTITLGPEDYMQDAVGSTAQLPTHEDSSANSTAIAVPGSPAANRCRPRVMPVNMKKPLGPNLFVLGEPVLHRYYTVYDWASKRVGFGLANSHRNRLSNGDSSSVGSGAMLKEEALEALEDEQEEIYLMQVSVTVTMC